MEVDDDDDLPAVNFNSPIKNSNFRSFNMPDTSVLAARRKLEDEQNNLVLRILSQEQEENTTDSTVNISDISQNTSNTSHFSMPDADLIAANRQLELQNDLLLDDLLKEHESIDKEEISSCLEVLHIEKSSNAIPAENPGIDITKLCIDNLIDPPSKIRRNFVMNYITKLEQCESQEHLQIVLDRLLVTLTEMYADKRVIIKLDDVVCHMLLVTAVLLDVRCRLVFTSVTVPEVLCQILQNVTPDLQTKETVSGLLSQILKNFTHFHNRLYIAECMIIKCNPVDIETDPSFLPTRLAKEILHSTLCELVGYSIDGCNSCSRYSEVRNVLSKGENIAKLSAYEQYVMLKLVNELKWMLDPSSMEKTKEKNAKSWIVSFFYSMKCNSMATKNSDFLKVKTLCSRIDLLWQMDSGDSET